MNGQTPKIPLREGLWAAGKTDSGAAPYLIGTICRTCGEILFPKKENRICTFCQSMETEDIPLSRDGVIYSYTVVMLRPPGYYRGPVPYAIGFVELSEGVRIETLFTGCDLESLYVGMPVELVIETLHFEENGDEIVTYKFRPKLR